MNTKINRRYRTVIAAGLALTLGCQQKLKLEDAPKSMTVNSVGELSEVMKGFGTNHTNLNIRRIYLPKNQTLEIRYDVDHDGVKDIAFRAGDIAYHRGEPQQIYYAMHSAELSDVAKREYQTEVRKILRKRENIGQEVYNIELAEIKFSFPLKWHKHISDFDGI